MVDRSGYATLDALRGLIEEADKLAPHCLVESALSELQELVSKGEKWEEKAKICLQAR